ncbi:Protein of unknown function [Pyronema omphalodes CBS 100304]|uniref:Uncharacterized protein n=1 Tax=Pyronema omphalodes (strain CBS 100304) TaxID=1076935 RepID=U4KYQ0_PYROM|nr:Protein of unknown function [Pyronema omphalodes CBS 100304]
MVEGRYLYSLFVHQDHNLSFLDYDWLK